MRNLDLPLKFLIPHDHDSKGILQHHSNEHELHKKEWTNLFLDFDK